MSDSARPLESAAFLSLEPWIRAHEGELRAAGLAIEFTKSSAKRSPASLSLDLNSRTVAAHIGIWCDGQAQIAVLDLTEKSELLNEHLPSVDDVGLQAVLDRLMSYLTQT